MGFREVGIYEKHAKLDGQWRDVVIVERLIPENVTPDMQAVSVPQIISLVAIVAGLVLFVVTMLGIDRDRDADRGAQPRRRAAARAVAGHRLAPAARGRLVCLLPARVTSQLLAGVSRAARGRWRRLLHDSRRRQRAAARRAADGPRLAGRQRRGVGARTHRDGHHERRRRRHLRRVRGVVRHAAGNVAGRVPRHCDHGRRRAVPVVPVPDCAPAATSGRSSSGSICARSGDGPAAARSARSAPSKICSSSWRAPTRAGCRSSWCSASRATG